MLKALNMQRMEDLIEQTVPSDIRLGRELALDDPRSEAEALEYLSQLARQNRVSKSYIGQGYYNTHMPAVIQRNVLENPGWYTAYTPYQPEISQGRLEGLLNFQQVIMDLTGMELANASLLDEATAAAEAMALCKRGNKKSKSNAFFVADDLFPQTLDVVKTRAEPGGGRSLAGRPEVAPVIQVLPVRPVGDESNHRCTAIKCKLKIETNIAAGYVSLVDFDREYVVPGENFCRVDHVAPEGCFPIISRGSAGRGEITDRSINHL